MATEISKCTCYVHDQNNTPYICTGVRQWIIKTQMFASAVHSSNRPTQNFCFSLLPRGFTERCSRKREGGGDKRRGTFTFLLLRDLLNGANLRGGSVLMSSMAVVLQPWVDPRISSGTDHVRFSPTRQTLIARSAKLRRGGLYAYHPWSWLQNHT